MIMVEIYGLRVLWQKLINRVYIYTFQRDYIILNVYVVSDIILNVYVVSDVLANLSDPSGIFQ